MCCVYSKFFEDITILAEIIIILSQEFLIGELEMI